MFIIRLCQENVLLLKSGRQSTFTRKSLEPLPFQNVYADTVSMLEEPVYPNIAFLMGFRTKLPKFIIQTNYDSKFD